LLATFLEHYTAHATDHTRVMPGVLDVLAELGGFPLAICTNKPRRTTDAVLEGLGIASLFACVIADGDLTQKKPDPEALRSIAARLGVRPEELVMVGDGPQDIECGRAAGARTVGVLGGIASRERLLAARPDRVIDTLGELPALVRIWAA
jgi:phosphoglycolate phosphatase